jgi:G:T-mismatch repair DNA endonuclease (very short patch repair protein)
VHEKLGDAFSVAEGRAAGLSPQQLRNPRLLSHFSGSRSRRRGADLLLERCAAYVPVAPDGFRFSHVTAAVLYGMPLPSRLERRPELHVAVRRGAPAPRHRGVVGHRISDTRLATPRGFPCVTPELAWLQLAAMLTLDELVVAGDHLVRRKRPSSTIELLAQVVAGRARGAVLARRALRDIRPGTDSPQESRMRLILLRAGLPEPVIGFRVHHDGYFVGTPDLAYVAERIAIEYEGEHHRLDAKVFRDDIDRRELFESAGWRVMRVTADNLRDAVRFVARVTRLLAERRGS